MNKILVTIEKCPKNFSAYIEDLPGCISTGKTIETVKRNIREAIKMHIELALKKGDNIPNEFLQPYILDFVYDFTG